MKRWRWLAIPATTYVISYLGLALYHGALLLIEQPIHESGQFTLAETIGYAPHILGHIPVYAIVALLFAGWYRWLGRPVHVPARGASYAGIFLTLLLLVLSVFSVNYFGMESTQDFVLQRKQSEVRFEQGGAWLLHLPSTLLCAVLLPPYLWGAMWVAGVRANGPRQGSAGYWLAALGLGVGMTMVTYGSVSAALRLVWTDPRYLAHSVRELATYPLTFFPLPLFFLLREAPVPMGSSGNRKRQSFMMGAALLFAAGLAYQMATVLRVGVSALAQQPAFAHDQQLPVWYLLASHNFEHLIDTGIFTAFVLLFLFRRRDNC